MTLLHEFSAFVSINQGNRQDLCNSTGMGEHSSGALTLEVELVDLPDSLLLEVFFWLPAQSLGCVARTCSRFYQIVKDELLWRAIFRRDFKVNLVGQSASGLVGRLAGRLGWR